MLFENALSGFRDEKIVIQIDTEAQGFPYKPESFLMNKFDIYSKIHITPKDMLLSQKIWAVLNRKKLKGRDFYDISFLFGLTQPNFEYLNLKAGISSVKQVKSRIAERLVHENIESLAKDVSPFLFDTQEIQRIVTFKEFIKSLR